MSTRFVPSPTRRSRPDRARCDQPRNEMRIAAAPRSDAAAGRRLRSSSPFAASTACSAQRLGIASSTHGSRPSSRSRTAPIRRRRIDRRPRTPRSGCSCTPVAATPHLPAADSTYSVPTRLTASYDVAIHADAWQAPRHETRSRCRRHAAATPSLIANIAADDLDAERRQAPDSRRGRNCARDRRAPAAARRCSGPEIRRRR